MEIEFVGIDQSNWFKCTELSVNPEQRHFVASNAFSLAQAAHEPGTYPLAIISNGEMVGFLMYAYDSGADEWWMCRLMIDAKYQGCGIGKAAVGKLLKLIAEKHGNTMLYTSAEPANIGAINLYEKMGFRKNGRIEDSEVVMEIQL